MHIAKQAVSYLLTGTLTFIGLLAVTPLAVQTLFFFFPQSEIGQQLFILVWADLAESPDRLYRKAMQLAMAAMLIVFYGLMARWLRTLSIRQQLKYHVTTLLWLLCLAVGAHHGITSVFGPRFAQCDLITRELNGGAREFGHETFHIELCGTHLDTFNYRQIRMRIFNPNHDLLITRNFTADWDSGTPRGLQYHADRILYFDAGDPENYTKEVTIPPSLIGRLSSWMPWKN